MDILEVMPIEDIYITAHQLIIKQGDLLFKVKDEEEIWDSILYARDKGYFISKEIELEILGLSRIGKYIPRDTLCKIIE